MLCFGKITADEFDRQRQYRRVSFENVFECSFFRFVIEVRVWRL